MEERFIMKKKALALVLTASVIMSMTACGAGESAATDAVEPAADTA